jgi:hypothetical protein
MIMLKKRAFILALGFAVMGALGAPAWADDDDNPNTVDADHDHVEHFKIYGGPAYVAPMSDDTITFGTVEDTVENQQHVGWNLGFEGRFNKLLGIEIDYVNASEDVDFGGSTIGDTTFSPLTATLNFHVVPAKHFDLYLGPSYTYVNWGDIHLNASGEGIAGGSTIGTDSAHGWGASLGMDIGWEHVQFYAGLKYLAVDLELADGTSIENKPLVGRLGVAFKF